MATEATRYYGRFIVDQIREIPDGYPIFTYELAEKVGNEFSMDPDRARKIVNTNMNRMNGTTIENFRRGIYYKPKKTAFGKSNINPAQVILMKYINPNGLDVIGYETGASLLNNLGLTSQIPAFRHIATNAAKHIGNRIVKDLKIIICKPNMEINTENFLYLQLLDAIENKDHIRIDTDRPYDLLNEFVEKNELDFGKLLAIATHAYSKEVVFRLAEFAEKTRL